MIVFTDKAKEKARFYMTGKSLEEWGVRIRSRGTRFDFSMEEIRQASPVDSVVKLDDIQVILDKGSEAKLADATVDFVETPFSSGFKVEIKQMSPPSGEREPDLSNPLARRVYEVLEREINPAIASHGGVARLVEVKGTVVFLQLGGGCQGCGMADATLRQGIEVRLKERIPEITEVVDVTDHASGYNPYFKP